METRTIDRIDIENANVPGRVRRVDLDMYAAMRRAIRMILPNESPGLTEAEIRERVIAHLPQGLFPKRAKVGWWAKTVQLDLEAKAVIVREKTKPLRWFKARDR